MPPKKSQRGSTKPAPRVSTDSESDEPAQGQEPSQSQEIDTKAIEALVKAQNVQSKAKKEQRKKDIEANRKRSVDKLQRKIDDLKRTHEAELRTLRNPKVAKLRELIQQRREIDKKLETCWNSIDQAYESTIQQYKFAIDGRLEDME